MNEDQRYVDRSEGVRDQLTTLRRTPSLFKVLTNFTLEEFEELCCKVCHTIVINARSTGLQKKVSGRPSKLSPEQRVLHFILYLKHDNIVQLEAYGWNYASSSSCDDGIFVASCINEALKEELSWPDAARRRMLGQHLSDFKGCIGHIDGTLVQIRRPSGQLNKTDHRKWYNGRKAMYAFNNTVVVDHDGLFIFIDAGYPGSFHDVSILRSSEFHANWREHFRHDDVYFEYVLGDPGYMGEEMYIMRRIDKSETMADGDISVTDAFNAMHAGHRVKVEWGIGGLKRKWRPFNEAL